MNQSSQPTVKTKPGDGYRNIQHNSFVVFLCRFSPKAETEVNGTAMYGRQLRLRKGRQLAELAKELENELKTLKTLTIKNKHIIIDPISIAVWRLSKFNTLLVSKFHQPLALTDVAAM